jgi:hypothetical protein
VNQDSVDVRQSQIANSAAVMLSDGALALFAIYALVLVFDILPPRLLDPNWMMNAALSLSGNLVIPLAGLVFLHLAAWMTPMSNSIQARRNFFASLARWAMIGFLLLIPLIGYATWASINSIKIQNQIQLNTAQKTANRLTRAIDAASTPAELQVSLLALNGPNIPNELLNQSLPQLKQQSRMMVNQAYKTLVQDYKSFGTVQYPPLFIRAAKALLLSIVSAFASAALAWNPLKQQSMLGEIMMGDFQQLKLLLNPKQFIANYKLNKEQRALSQDARKRVLEIEKLRQDEAKKNAAATRKQSLERKREMEKYIKEEKRKRSNRID